MSHARGTTLTFFIIHLSPRHLGFTFWLNPSIMPLGVLLVFMKIKKDKFLDK